MQTISDYSGYRKPGPMTWDTLATDRLTLLSLIVGVVKNSACRNAILINPERVVADAVLIGRAVILGSNTDI